MTIDSVTHKTREKIRAILNAPDVSGYTKEIIRMGLNRDCVDAVREAQLAVDALEAIRDDILKGRE